MKQTLTIGWFVGTKFLRYILLSFHSIRECRDIGSLGMECIGLATKKVRGFEATFQFCQNDTFEPVHEIQKFSWPKDFF